MISLPIRLIDIDARACAIMQHIATPCAELQLHATWPTHRSGIFAAVGWIELDRVEIEQGCGGSAGCAR